MGRFGLAVVIVAALASCATGAKPERRLSADVEWYLRSVAAEGRTINVVYTMSGVASDCQRKGTPSVQESSDSVVVIARKSVTADRNRACTEELAYIEESVTLDEPLGDRALVGCRPPSVEPSEDTVCRDLERSREHGIMQFSPRPSVG